MWTDKNKKNIMWTGKNRESMMWSLCGLVNVG